MVHSKQNLTRKKKDTEQSVLQRKAKLMQGLPQRAFLGSPRQYERRQALNWPAQRAFSGSPSQYERRHALNRPAQRAFSGSPSQYERRQALNRPAQSPYPCFYP